LVLEGFAIRAEELGVGLLVYLVDLLCGAQAYLIVPGVGVPVAKPWA
jgi:hypothetical protein